MQEVNYYQIFLKTINQLKQSSKKPRLLLHACCGPCSTACLQALNNFFDVTILFYNPNIHPQEEYLKRYNELLKFVEQKNKQIEENQNTNIQSETNETTINVINKKEINSIVKETNVINLNKSNQTTIKVMEVEYNPNEFFSTIKGLENEKEGGKRCEKCFLLRLEKTAQICTDKDFDYFTTTLTVSPHKNSKLINQIGENLQDKYKAKYLFSNFKKEDGYKKSIELSKQYNLYRQDYCGCIFSKKERDQQKLEKQNKENIE